MQWMNDAHGLYVTVHAYVSSNGICRSFAFKYGKFRKKCKANKFASSRQMWYITYSDEICLFLEKRRENKTYEENKI